MTPKQKKELLHIVGVGVLYGILLVIFHLVTVPWYVERCCFLVPYALVGWEVVYDAVRNISHGQVFDENFLMLIASVGALVVGEYAEAVAVMLFYQLGEWFQRFAVGRSRQSISDLMDICPEFANIETEEGLTQVDPDDVEIGSTIVIRPGERIPLDGVVLRGSSLVDTSALTGESVPRTVEEGDDVISGCINGQGLLYVRTTKDFDNSTVAKILELVENSADKKAKTEAFITRFARYYTPAVVFAALALALIPPLFLGGWLEWIRRACTLLVISCPCALVISVPMSFFSGIGAASKSGILVKGSNYLEALSHLDTVVFDKTGTLTHGTFTVTQVYAVDGDTKNLLALAGLAEQYSDHPIARSVVAACETVPDGQRVSDVREISGRGVQVTVDSVHALMAGNLRMMEENGIDAPACDGIGSLVYLALDGTCLGWILISDQVKEDAKDAIAQLKGQGISKTVMLTGDRKEVGEATANALGMDQVYTQLLPGDKVDRVEALLSQSSAGKTLAFVGDGINDAPVLTRADIGIAMGAMGSDAAIEAADIVLMDDKPSRIPVAVAIARKTMGIVRQNIIFALGIKGLFLILGALGLANMWEAVFADVGVAVLAILNAMRALKQ